MLVACGPTGTTVSPATSIRTSAYISPAVNVTDAREVEVTLQVSKVAGGNPTLDVKVQTTIDGASWCDVAAFGQLTSVGTATVVFSSHDRAAYEVPCTDGTLPAGVIHPGLLGEKVRIRHEAPGGTNALFDYRLTITARR